MLLVTEASSIMTWFANGAPTADVSKRRSFSFSPCVVQSSFCFVRTASPSSLQGHCHTVYKQNRPQTVQRDDCSTVQRISKIHPGCALTDSCVNDSALPGEAASEGRQTCGFKRSASRRSPLFAESRSSVRHFILPKSSPEKLQPTSDCLEHHPGRSARMVFEFPCSLRSHVVCRGMLVQRAEPAHMSHWNCL